MPESIPDLVKQMLKVVGFIEVGIVAGPRPAPMTNKSCIFDNVTAVLIKIAFKTAYVIGDNDVQQILPGPDKPPVT
ncbi:hypothetical protein F442_06450 [Phytophthora nicotianae P10297]|uniref:Uncharacterized protein n=3 Tax=Phytophthora nicotianae TaxID=4792 RepID=V9FEM3_PHYNI|nr:hypothetical protein F443_06406 [Phytophthora nicotianae P1569]ETO78650.1 hypothetical protein F444_06470 [Phytophthora nicotianae P1976]ETP47631.1 hypothetical protein F442_06450 [Phytophthora nicotianae P10297]